MSENTLDLLMHIVDNILSDQTQVPTHSMISDALSEAGVSPLKVESTISWFEKMVDQTQKSDYTWADEHAENTRIFSAEERQKLSSECCHFLMQAEQLDMIMPSIR